MVTLDSFYKSKEWEKLLAVIKMERVNEHGFIVCAHCGKPITKKYDCIGHHTIFLTEENVNDTSISLNPELIWLVHHRCHNLIHDKLGCTRREIYMVYGPPLSGKSTYVETVREPGDLIVDIDEVWHCISGCPIHTKPPKLNAVAFKIRDQLMECVRYRLGKWDRCYIIGGFALTSERERILRETGATEIRMDASEAECLARLKGCEDRDPEEYKKYIREWFRLNNPPGGS